VRSEREDAEAEFAIICSAGGTDKLDELFGDHHLAFERIWQLARQAAFAEARKAVEGAWPTHDAETCFLCANGAVCHFALEIAHQQHGINAALAALATPPDTGTPG
jgi:hypothetical protein